MARKFRILLVFIALSLSLCIMSNTYSRYVASATGDLEVAVAKWQILLNNNDITNNTSSTITLTPVVETNANVADNKIAPSSKGYFDIVVNPTNVDVSFDYSIGLSITNTDMPDVMISKYAIMDSTYKDGDELTYTTISNGVITGSSTYDKTKAYTPFTVRVYFEWYEGTDEKMDDATDTTAGSNAATANTAFTVTANIAFTQKI